MAGVWMERLVGGCMGGLVGRGGQCYSKWVVDWWMSKQRMREWPMNQSMDGSINQ